MFPYRDSRIVRAILFLFFVILIGYALFEAQGILYGPSIELQDKAESPDQQLVHIRGKAERITELRLNGATISVTEGGDFDEPYLLAPGSNRIILEARDARGRSAVQALDYIYTPSEAAFPPLIPATTTPIATSTEETPLDVSTE